MWYNNNVIKGWEPPPNKMKRGNENEKFKVVAESPTVDVETNVNSYFEALEMFERCKTPSGVFTRVYIMDNETGELYHTYDIVIECGGIKTVEWAKI